jgi:hypothetical protein
MPNRENFILGYGERLTDAMTPPPSMMHKQSPYSFDEAKTRLSPGARETATKLVSLPDSACPGGQTVAAFTLHPTYTAKSYYPDALFQELGLEAIGSKQEVVTPQKWTRQGEPQQQRTTTLFVKGQKSNFEQLEASIAGIDPASTAAKDLVKIETIRPISDMPRIRGVSMEEDVLDLEIALHVGHGADQSTIIEGFERYVGDLDAEINLATQLKTSGLCFVGVKAPKDNLEEIAKYSFLRSVRQMPRIRRLTRSASGLNFEAMLPDSAPIDPSIRVAIFDGGVPEGTILEPWVRRYDADGIGVPVDKHLLHGVGVTGALLFGTLQSGSRADRPYSFVDHYRVLDEDDDELTVLHRILTVLEANNYKYANISVGPPTPIDYGEIDPWTSALDEVFVKKQLLVTIATGNAGDLEEVSGNALIQPPSDTVNGLAVGAANSTRDDWQRADYSSYGPGRTPGVIKPEVVGFGGQLPDDPFYLVSPSGAVTWKDHGTSYAAPTVLRTALGIRAHFGEVLSPIALKALLIHGAEDVGHERKHCGWGRVPSDFRDIVSTEGHSARIVYQGTLSPAGWMNVQIPMPTEQLTGMVTIQATLCYFTPVDSEDPNNYTKAGIEIRFRPHSEKRTREAKTGERQMYPDSQSFFQAGAIDVFDDELTHNAHFWETALSAQVTKRATSLHDPVFNLHYNARSNGGRADDGPEINYALVVTVTAKNHDDIYDKVLNRYQTHLQPLQPVIQLPVVASIS